MAEQIPLVVINGDVKQLPTGDTLPAASIPASAAPSLGLITAISRNNVLV